MNSYEKGYELLNQCAIQNNFNHYEIVEDNYEYENGLLLIVYYDEKHEYEVSHICIDLDMVDLYCHDFKDKEGQLWDEL